MTHQPKGSMCMSCDNAGPGCASLPFATMPVIKRYPDGVKAVKCASHSPPARRCLICGASAPAVIEEGQGAPCGH